MVQYYTSIQDLIDSIKTEEISYRNLHTNIYIKNKDDTIKIPYKSIVRQYLPFFEQTVIEVPLSDMEIPQYRYKPKLLSLHLYGTTELWSSLLEINNMLSIVDFNKDTYKLFKPDDFKVLLNEVMILENIIV